MKADNQIAVIMPCFKSRDSVLSVLSDIPEVVNRIYVIDDGCPYKTGNFTFEQCVDSRVTVLFNLENSGVGGAMVTGYLAALHDGYKFLVKIDSDGQMDSRNIPKLLKPLLAQRADYTKGNRFYHPTLLSNMPFVRIFGNAVLSFMSKLTSGYWHVMDPTNGFTAINSKVLTEIPLQKLHSGYFFESDLLFRLNLLDAVVIDVPMTCKYNTGIPSNLKIHKILPLFCRFHAQNLLKRILYKYFIRDFNFGSMALLLGASSFSFGTIFCLYHWMMNFSNGVSTPLGTIAIAALTLSFGVIMILFFFVVDITQNPKSSINKVLDEC